MDPEVVGRAGRGDAEAFAELAREAAPKLYGIAYRILRDPDAADDALQSALIAIWHDLPKLRDPASLEAWSCRILVRIACRQASQERQLLASVRLVSLRSDGPDIATDVAAHDLLERGFRRLSAEHRAALVLHYVEGLPAAAIAGILGIPVGTATSRIHYATRQMRAALEADARGVATLERTV